jgi:hypothetical protein
MWEIAFAAIMFGSCAVANHHWHHKPAAPPAVTQEYSSSRDTKVAALPWDNQPNPKADPNWEVNPLPDVDPYRDMFPEPRYDQQFRTNVI